MDSNDAPLTPEPTREEDEAADLSATSEDSAEESPAAAPSPALVAGEDAASDSASLAAAEPGPPILVTAGASTPSSSASTPSASTASHRSDLEEGNRDSADEAFSTEATPTFQSYLPPTSVDSTDGQPSGSVTPSAAADVAGLVGEQSYTPKSTHQSSAADASTPGVMVAPASLFDVVDQGDTDDSPFSSPSSTFFLTGVDDVSLPSSTSLPATVDPTPEPIPSTPSNPSDASPPTLPPIPVLFSIDSIPPSTLLPNLSLSALNCLLDFKRRPRPPPSSTHPPSPLPTTSSSLSAALRNLTHTLAHPLATPSIPSHLAVYQLPTISSSHPPPTHPHLHPPHPRSLSPLSPHPQWDVVRTQVEQVRAEVSRLGHVWALDEVSAGLLKGVGWEGAGAGGGGVRGDGAVVSEVRCEMRGVRKARVDYVAAAHVREVSRVRRRRQREREEAQLRDLVEAVAQLTQPQTQQARP